MILPYLLRLVCLCFASFFMLNAVGSVIVGFLARSGVRSAELKPAASAARFLFLLRLAPCAIATLFVFGLCVPSYLWLEPSATPEKVGALCIVSGIMGVACWLLSVARAVRAVLYQRLCDQRWNSHAYEGNANGDRRSLLIIDSDFPMLAVSGLLRRRFIVSRSVLDSLSAEELDSALSHEHAHGLYHDNVKRLVLLLMPDIFPFVRSLRLVEENWSRFTEWAADDHAAHGNALRAVALASALVRVARLGVAPRLPALSTSLLACNGDLSARVERLLHSSTSAAPASKGWRFGRQPFQVLAASVGLGILCAAILSPVHELLERFLR